MKILVVHNDHRFGGGSDVVAAATARLLIERGHQVIRFWRDSKQLHGISGKIKAFSNGLYAPGAVKEFTSLLAESSPDVVHAHDVYPLISPWIFRACRRLRIPSVLTCHDYRMVCPAWTHMRNGAICRECLDHGTEWPCIRHNCLGNHTQSIAYALRNAVARVCNLYQEVDYFATPSQFARNWLIENAKIPAAKIAAVGNPVASPLTQTPYVPEERCYAGFLGRLAPEKGIEILLEAAVKVEIPIRLAGDHSAYRPRLESPLIQYEGQLSGAPLEKFFAGMRVLVMPSLWFETFGMVAAEAMLRGIPVICSNLGAMAEMVEDGVNGLLVPPGDINALAQTLKRAWENPAMLRKMSAQAQLKAEQFTPAQYVQRVERAYRAAANLRQT